MAYEQVNNGSNAYYSDIGNGPSGYDSSRQSFPPDYKGGPQNYGDASFDQTKTDYAPQTTVRGTFNSSRAGNQASRPWKAGVFHNMPWMGIGSLIIAVLSAFATIACLVSANGKDKETWPTEKYPVQLTVVLAALIAVGNATLTYSYGEGVTRSWWVKMLRGGDLADSHRYWEYGSSAMSSILGITHLNKVSVASIVLLLLIADGPLLQRAAGTEQVDLTESATFKAPLSTGELSQPTGFYMTHAASVNTLSLNFSRVVQDFTNRNAITLDLEGCDGTCSGTLIAAGFDFNCTKSTSPYNLDLKAGANTTIGSIALYASGYDAGIVEFQTSYKAATTEKGNLINNDCIAHIGQVKYPVHVVNGTVTLSSLNMDINDTISLYYPPMERPGLGITDSLLGGIAFALNIIYGGDVVVYQSGTLAFMGDSPMQYTYMTSNESALGTSAMTWEDPTPSVLEAVRELTFRTAIAFSNSSASQTVQGTYTHTVTRYTLHAGFLAGTLAIVALSTLVVAFLFNGYWLVGRDVSMSPLEIATAFQAPMMTGVDSNASADELLDQVGSRPVKYGALHLPDGNPVMDSENQVLAMAPPNVVSWPLRRNR